MFLSTLSFFIANVLVKQVGHLPAMEIIFFRCITASTISVAGLRHLRASLIGNNHLLLLMRGLFGTAALYFFFVTLQQMPLAPAQTIQYLSPIFTATIAIFVLKEALKPAQWLFYAIAFGGVLLIERFDDRISVYYLVFGIISAASSGMAYNLVRSMRGREHPLTIVFHFQLVGAVVGGLFVLFEWQTPQGMDWLFLVLIGVFSQIGQIFLTNALQREPIAGVAIINYTGLVYALLVGWMIYDEEQGIMSLLGMLMVVAGVLMSVFYGRRQKRLLEELEATAA